MRRPDLKLVSFSLLFTLIIGANYAQSPEMISCSRADLAADVALIDEVLRETHPGLFLYQTQEEFDSRQQLLLAMADDDLNLLEAYQLLAGLVDGIQDGHTNLMLGERQIDWILTHERFFPFTFRFLEGKVYINHNFSEHDYLDRGTEVLAVNGVSMPEILEELSAYITCDGNSRQSELEALEGQFWWYYALRYGFPSTFNITYQDSEQKKTILVSPLNYSDRYEMLSEVYGFEWSPDNILDFKLDGDRAIMTITQFHGVSKWAYQRFLKNSFRQIEQAGIDHLIIDIRKNGGGREGYENLLFSYLYNTLDEKYEEVSVTQPVSEHYDNFQAGTARRIQDRFLKTFEFQKEEDGWSRRTRFANTLEPKRYQFDGSTYVLIAGQVFSGGAEFASMAKAYVPNCTLIGTETSGGSKQNTSGYYYKLTLPNTGFTLEIPRVYFRLNVPVENEAAGVVPHIQSDCTYQDFISNTDTQLQTAMDLIETEFLSKSAMKE